jgi:hypothetical protein
MNAERMEHAVRNMALLAALIGILGAGPAMSKEAHLAGWLYSCARSDRTEAVIPAFTTSIERLSASHPAVRDVTAAPTGIEASAQMVTTLSLPDREGLSVWTPNPAVTASLLR